MRGATSMEHTWCGEPLPWSRCCQDRSTEEAENTYSLQVALVSAHLTLGLGFEASGFLDCDVAT